MFALLIEQVLNGLQLGVMLFMIAAGLTLVFGVMGVLNLAHGALYMVGAFAAAFIAAETGSVVLGILVAMPVAALAGLLIERLVIARLYARDHLDQVLATFGIVLFANEMMRILFGPRPLFLNVPDFAAGTLEILPGVPYPVWRLVIILVGLVVAGGLALLIERSRLGMLIRAGAQNRRMVAALGVDIGRLYAVLFALGGLLAGLAGAVAGPVLAVQVGMGEPVLILAFVVIVIGGIGSVRGAFTGALVVGLADTLGRAYLPELARAVLPPAAADQIGAALASMTIYLLMALVLAIRPKGVFGGRD
ncbi:branched-chain amino acid ABC transporter permease [Tistrella bauzanensis]|uniref:Branched-chain amino acid ABC transporter permease n=1 Tax=Tistrella bauzanensis TaxID=657419 RepID=A0ABQ1IPW4_9PROT|nr:branched-chain amino acid ABC transporter permease [Tistrella bauzanensis]GGB47215.1 branched-chain amino acid ABC transporter permease [Tistrella bauzanensis]